MKLLKIIVKNKKPIKYDTLYLTVWDLLKNKTGKDYPKFDIK